MMNIENIFQNGKIKQFAKDSTLFAKNQGIGDDAVFFIKKGLVKLQIPRRDLHDIKIYLREGDFVGVPEVYAESQRLTTALCESEIECYVCR